MPQRVAANAMKVQSAAAGCLWVVTRGAWVASLACVCCAGVMCAGHGPRPCKCHWSPGIHCYVCGTVYVSRRVQVLLITLLQAALVAFVGMYIVGCAHLCGPCSAEQALQCGRGQDGGRRQAGGRQDGAGWGQDWGWVFVGGSRV
jgi:hypothetical protein